MAKKKNIEELDIPNDFETPGEFTIGDAPMQDLPGEEPEAPKWKYVGPPYALGIKLHRVPTMFRPAEFTDEEVDAFLAAHPTCSHWWLS